MIAVGSIRLTSSEQMRDVVTRAAAAGAHQLPAFHAASEGAIWLTMMSNAATPAPSHLLDFSRPHLVIIGDDPAEGCDISLGPDAWTCMRRLRYFQPRCAIVHATGGEPQHYRKAVATTLLHGRVLLIETSSSMGPLWGRAMQSLCPTMVMLPRNGQHPVAETRH